MKKGPSSFVSILLFSVKPFLFSYCFYLIDGMCNECWIQLSSTLLPQILGWVESAVGTGWCGGANKINVKCGKTLIWGGNWNVYLTRNKANLRDLIAATGLVIFLKFDPNHLFFSLCDLEILCMTSKNNRAPLLYYIKLCVSFQIHRRIKTEVTLWKHSIQVKIGDFLSRVTLKFDGWPLKTIGHLFYTTPSFVHHLKSIGEFKLGLQSGNAQFGSKSAIFFPVWPWN